MKTMAFPLICALLFPFSAPAAEVLAFTPQITDDDLAEEAIQLLRCLAARSGRSWELSPAPAGAFWLTVRQTGPSLAGTYHKAGSEQSFPLQPGGAQAACEKLEPQNAATLSLGPAEAPPAIPPLPAPEQEGSRARVWVLAGAVAILAGGFLLWKSSRPDYRELLIH